jgi:hypothetical protein
MERAITNPYYSGIGDLDGILPVYVPARAGFTPSFAFNAVTM